MVQDRSSDLLELAAAIVEIPSVSGDERVLADFVERRLRGIVGLETARVGDNVVARSHGRAPARLLLAGHLDTVPAPAGALAVRRSVDVLEGLGAVDMKGGLAVLLALAAGGPRPGLEATYVFYAREEVARSRSGLLELARERPDLLAADAAIVAEPTGGVVEAGCQGVLRARAVLHGARAHTARPWVGRNAIHRLAGVLSLLASFPGREPVIEGCRYREALEAVAISGGIAGNVVPDEASVVIAHRFAPDRDANRARAWLESYLRPAMDLAGGDELVIEEAAPAATPGLDHELLASLVAKCSAPPRAKLGWTDVAFFAERGIPAANFGPGDPLMAHTERETLRREEIEGAFAVLDAVLSH